MITNIYNRKTKGPTLGYEKTPSHYALGYRHLEGPVGWQQLYLIYQPSEFLHILQKARQK